MKRLSAASTPREVYHGVPLGWSLDEVVHRYAALGGTRGFLPPEATEPGAPSWLPDRSKWLQYRAALYCLANGVRAGDPVCVELAIEYIELNYFGSYSGYVRERLARALKHAELNRTQAGRLKRHFLALREQRLFLQEFREYRRLEARIDRESPDAQSAKTRKRDRRAAHQRLALTNRESDSE